MIPLDSFTIGYLIFDDSLPSLIWMKIKKFGDSLTWKYINLEDLPNVYFMCFDRYEIHIQAFVDFIFPLFSDPQLHKNILRNIYSTYLAKNNFQKNNAHLQVEKIKKSLVFEF